MCTFWPPNRSTSMQARPPLLGRFAQGEPRQVMGLKHRFSKAGAEEGQSSGTELVCSGAWVYTFEHRRPRPMDSKKPNRRGFLRGSAVAAGLAAGGGQLAKGQTQGTPAKKIDELIAYGDRSRFVTSIRVPVAERHSPDEFGLTFHVLTPLQDSYGIITPSSLHYTATHRGAFVPDIDPNEHRLMIHGMVDRPLVFTMDELKRLPYVSRSTSSSAWGIAPSRRTKRFRKHTD